MYISLADLVAERKTLQEAQFCLAHPTPVLLHAVEDTGRDGFFTRLSPMDEDESLEQEVGLATHPSLSIIPLDKRPGGPFADRIGIGRSRATDVSLPYSDVSKYHAFVTWTEDRTEYFLTDAGSKNGTWIGSVRLEPRVAMRLEERAIITLGDHYFRFHTPKGLYRVLSELIFGN